MQVISHPHPPIASKKNSSAAQPASKSEKARPQQATDTVTFGMNSHPATSGDTADLIDYLDLLNCAASHNQSLSATASDACSTFVRKNDGKTSLPASMDESQSSLHQDFLINPAESFSAIGQEKELLTDDWLSASSHSWLDASERRLLHAKETTANKPARDALVSKLQLAQVSPRLTQQLMRIKNKTERYILMDRILCKLTSDSLAWTPENLAAHNQNGIAKKLEQDLQKAINEKNKSHPHSAVFNPEAWTRYENLKLNQFCEELKQAPEISLPTVTGNLLES